LTCCSIDQRVAKIVQHVRLVGAQLKRFAEIDLHQGEIAHAFMYDAACIMDRPSTDIVTVTQIKRFGIGCDGLGLAVLPAQIIAKRGIDGRVLGVAF